MPGPTGRSGWACLVLTAALVMAAAGSIAAAQDQEPEAVIARQDQDGDGRLSAAEFKGPAQKFARIDRDGDGFITLAELAAAQGGGQAGGSGSKGDKGSPTPEGVIGKQDQDGDGRLSQAEFKGGDAKFGRIDKNGDGFIDHAELAAAQAGGGPEGSRGGAKAGSAGGGSCSAIKDTCDLRCAGQNPNPDIRVVCLMNCNARWESCMASGQSCGPDNTCRPVAQQ